VNAWKRTGTQPACSITLSQTQHNQMSILGIIILICLLIGQATNSQSERQSGAALTLA
jgi:hypothetical protein